VPSLVVDGDEGRRLEVVGVEQWAELRRLHFVGGKSIKWRGPRWRCQVRPLALAGRRDPSRSRRSGGAGVARDAVAGTTAARAAVADGRTAAALDALVG